MGSGARRGAGDSDVTTVSSRGGPGGPVPVCTVTLAPRHGAARTVTPRTMTRMPVTPGPAATRTTALKLNFNLPRRPGGSLSGPSMASSFKFRLWTVSTTPAAATE